QIQIPFRVESNCLGILEKMGLWKYRTKTLMAVVSKQLSPNKCHILNISMLSLFMFWMKKAICLVANIALLDGQGLAFVILWLSKQRHELPNDRFFFWSLLILPWHSSWR
ncbi:hypothetical protein ACJX0J_020848, partial [Zea mays]